MSNPNQTWTSSQGGSVSSSASSSPQASHSTTDARNGSTSQAQGVVGGMTKLQLRPVRPSTSAGTAGGNAASGVSPHPSNATVWHSYSPAVSAANSPTASMPTTPDSSRPNSPREHFESDAQRSPGIKRSTSSDFLSAEAAAARPKQTSPRALTSRGLAHSPSYQEYLQTVANEQAAADSSSHARLPPDAITLPGTPPSSIKVPPPVAIKFSAGGVGPPLPKGLGSGSRPSSPRGTPPSFPTTPVPNRSSPSPSFGNSSAITGSTPPPAPPVPPEGWRPSSPHSLSNSPAASGDVKAMLKDLKKKEKEEKKAKKKEEKEEKKALKEAKKLKAGKSSTSGSVAIDSSKRSTKDSNNSSSSAPASPSRTSSISTSTTSPPTTTPTPPTTGDAHVYQSGPTELLRTLAAAEERGGPSNGSPLPLRPDPSPLRPVRAPPTPPGSSVPKTTLADFRVIKLIGKGGFGEVYLVEHIQKKKKMALKVLHKSSLANEAKAQQVLNERAVLVKSFKSPFLLSLSYCFRDDKHIYFAMKYCPGGDLRALLSAIGTFEEEEARLYMAEMIVSVDALHRLGYIHRDLKPDNFLIDAKGHLVLADFGLSKEVHMSRNSVMPEQPGGRPPLARERSLSTIHGPSQAHIQSSSMLLGPQDLVALNATNLDSRFIRRKRRDANDMTLSYNPLTQSYTPSGNDGFGAFTFGAPPSTTTEPFGFGSYVPPPNNRASVIFDSDNPMSSSYNPMTATFSPKSVRPVIQYSDLPSKAERRRMMAYSVVGSPDYMSPEVLAEHGYGEEVDWWSVGCLCFELVLGIPPFTGQTIQEVFDNIANWETRLPQILEEYSSYLSPTCFDLLSQLLCDPSKRLGKGGIAEIKKHPFFAGLDWDRLLEEEPPFVPRLENEEDTSYFEANVLNKQGVLPAVSATPNKPSPAEPITDSPNDYYRQFSYCETDLAPHMRSATKSPN